MYLKKRELLERIEKLEMSIKVDNKNYNSNLKDTKGLLEAIAGKLGCRIVVEEFIDTNFNPCSGPLKIVAQRLVLKKIEVATPSGPSGSAGVSGTGNSRTTKAK